MTGEPNSGDALSIQAVSDLLSVPAATIRSWERRYGLTRTPRTGGGHRRYFADDVADLRLMRDEISRGRRPARAATLVRDAGRGAEPYHSFIDTFIDVAETMDVRRLHLMLEVCRDRFGVDETIRSVVLPGLREVGVAWQTGRADIAQEHVVTQGARRWLSKVLLLESPRWHQNTIVLSCGPADQHTVGLEAMEVLLARRGWHCHMLGDSIPAAALRAAILRTGAVAAVVVSHVPTHRRTTLAALRAAEQTGAQLFYAGNAFLTPESRSGSPGVYLGDDLIAAADLVGDRVRNAPVG